MAPCTSEVHSCTCQHLSAHVWTQKNERAWCADQWSARLKQSESVCKRKRTEAEAAATRRMGQRLTPGMRKRALCFRWKRSEARAVSPPVRPVRPIRAHLAHSGQMSGRPRGGELREPQFGFRPRGGLPRRGSWLRADSRHCVQEGLL
jgi:hypothetical protein